MMKKIWWWLVRTGFHLLYNQMAFTYDAVSYFVSMGAWRCWQRAALQFLSPDKNTPVLELAHGTGNLQLNLHAAGYTTIVGYDLSPAMGRITTRKLHKKHISPRLIRGQAQQLPFADDSFTTVISTFPTDFIVADSTLREVYRILQSEGVFIIVISGMFTGRGLFKNFLEWLYRIIGQRDDHDSDIIGYFREYGFYSRLETVTCPRSQAQLIIATIEK